MSFNSLHCMLLCYLLMFSKCKSEMQSVWIQIKPDHFVADICRHKNGSHSVVGIISRTADMRQTADPGVASLIPPWSHTFVEIDHEIIPTAILLPSRFKKSCCLLLAKVFAQSTD